MSSNANHASAASLGNTQVGKSFTSVTDNCGNGAEGFYVIKNCGALESTGNGRKWRTDTRNAAVAFQRFEERGFFTAFVGTGASLRIKVELKLRTSNAFTQIATSIGFGQSLVHDVDQVAVFATNVDPTLFSTNGQGCNQNAFN